MFMCFFILFFYPAPDNTFPVLEPGKPIFFSDRKVRKRIRFGVCGSERYVDGGKWFVAFLATNHALGCATCASSHSPSFRRFWLEEQHYPLCSWCRVFFFFFVVLTLSWFFFLFLAVLVSWFRELRSVLQHARSSIGYRIDARWAELTFKVREGQSKRMADVRANDP